MKATEAEMTAKTTAAQANEDVDPPTPPLMPDPEIVGNIEGNRRLRDQDRASARKERDQAVERG